MGVSALGDILKTLHHRNNLPLLITNRRGTYRYDHPRPVRSQEFNFFSRDRFAFLQRTGQRPFMCFVRTTVWMESSIIVAFIDVMTGGERLSADPLGRFVIEQQLA